MKNDICSMIYWYQLGAPRRFVKTPEWKQLLPATVLKAAEQDIPPPNTGSWGVGPVLENETQGAVRDAMKPMAGDRKFTGQEWIARNALHGFIDFNHVHRPKTRGAGSHFVDKAAEAVATLEAPNEGPVKIRLVWDDQLVLRVNNGAPIDLGSNPFFRRRTVEVPLNEGTECGVGCVDQYDGQQSWQVGFCLSRHDRRWSPAHAKI